MVLSGSEWFKGQSSLSNLLNFQNLRIYASIENVFSWDGYDYFSVESSNSSTSSTNGIRGNYDYGAYPSARVYSIGLNVTF